MLLLCSLIFYDLSTARGNYDKECQLLDGLIDGTLVPEESHEDLAFQEHQVKQFIAET